MNEAPAGTAARGAGRGPKIVRRTCGNMTSGSSAPGGRGKGTGGLPSKPVAARASAARAPTPSPVKPPGPASKPAWAGSGEPVRAPPPTRLNPVQTYSRSGNAGLRDVPTEEPIDEAMAMAIAASLRMEHAKQEELLAQGSATMDLRTNTIVAPDVGPKITLDGPPCSAPDLLSQAPALSAALNLTACGACVAQSSARTGVGTAQRR